MSTAEHRQNIRFRGVLQHPPLYSKDPKKIRYKVIGVDMKGDESSNEASGAWRNTAQGLFEAGMVEE